MTIKTAMRDEARRIYNAALAIDGRIEIMVDEALNFTEAISGYIRDVGEESKEIWTGLSLITALIEELPDD